MDGLPHLVNGERVTFVYQIDVNPASPKFNSVVNTFYLNQSSTQAQTAQPQIAPTGGREVTVSADGLHVFITAPNYFENSDPNEPLNPPNPNAFPDDLQNGNLIELTLDPSVKARPPPLPPRTA